jgi:1,4-alpha-glucan branching enzyme
MPNVRFVYSSGLPARRFANAALRGSWDAQGRLGGAWSERPMSAVTCDDGCPGFEATVSFPASEIGRRFEWDVVGDGPAGRRSLVATEEDDPLSRRTVRAFVLREGGQLEQYHLVLARWLGANAVHRADTPRGLRFALWAPNARAVEVVFNDGRNGYVSDDGTGAASRPSVPLAPAGGGIWETGVVAPALGDYGRDEFTSYLFRVTRDDGSISYRTDLYSRWQVGQGSFDPQGRIYGATAAGLDGAVSCSAVVDPETLPTCAGGAVSFVPCSDFWRDEHDPARPVPTRLEDLVIYELHVGALGVGRPDAGNLEDALSLLDEHLVPLGVNAIELLPMAEFSGDAAWGYGNSHHLAIEMAAGGRDALMRFVRACHHRGVAVIMDVVYNHWDLNAARAQWQVDSVAPEENIYYWYEGAAAERSTPEGGYVNNGSSGWAPRYWEEQVRRLFAASAALLVDEFHVDGFRVDLLDAIHRDNRLNEAGGPPVPRANLYGAKMLREWARTLRLLRPPVMLIAEDHTGWGAGRRRPTRALRFDAAWYVDFFHHLVGPRAEGMRRHSSRRRATATTGARPRSLDGSLHAAGSQVVYRASQTRPGTGSARTIVLAVDGAPLVDATRDSPGARRSRGGLAMLSPGTPMFLMGRRSARRTRTGDDFLEHRDLLDLRLGFGQQLFRYYQDIIRFRLAGRRSAHGGSGPCTATRRTASSRSCAGGQLLVVASFANRSYAVRPTTP